GPATRDSSSNPFSQPVGRRSLPDTTGSLPPRAERDEKAVAIRQVGLQGLLKFDAERNFVGSRVVLRGTVPDIPADACSDPQIVFERNIPCPIDLQMAIWFDSLTRRQLPVIAGPIIGSQCAVTGFEVMRDVDVEVS